MAKMITVTEASIEGLEFDKKISVNADNINRVESANEEDVGESTIIFDDGTRINVQETIEELNELINS